MAEQQQTQAGGLTVKVVIRDNQNTVALSDVLDYDLATINDIRLIFMPTVSELIKDGTTDGTTPNTLTDKFLMPRFFFEPKFGIESNGFFGSKKDKFIDTADPSKNYTYRATWSRFLSKKVEFTEDTEGIPTNVKGIWHYMSFYTLTIGSSGGLLFCFDLDPDVETSFEKSFKKWAGVSKNEYLPQLLCPAVVDLFDEDVWTFRAPIRAFENKRLSNDNVEVERLHKRYAQMHELSRHVIHISETLKVATRMMEATAEDRRLSKGANAPQPDSLGPLMSMKYRLNNLEDRAQAFVSRLNNEIKLAFNTAGAVQLEQTRNEGKTFADTIALLTLFFLPGTFVSGFFGMNFFSLEVDNGDNKWYFSQWFWIFFACTIPITLICLVLFAINLPIISKISKWEARLKAWRHRSSAGGNTVVLPQQPQNTNPGPAAPAVPPPRSPSQASVKEIGTEGSTSRSSDRDSSPPKGDPRPSHAAALQNRLPVPARDHSNHVKTTSPPDLESGNAAPDPPPLRTAVSQTGASVPTMVVGQQAGPPSSFTKGSGALSGRPIPSDVAMMDPRAHPPLKTDIQRSKLNRSTDPEAGSANRHSGAVHAAAVSPNQNVRTEVEGVKLQATTPANVQSGRPSPALDSQRTATPHSHTATPKKEGGEAKATSLTTLEPREAKSDPKASQVTTPQGPVQASSKDSAQAKAARTDVESANGEGNKGT